MTRIFLKTIHLTGDSALMDQIREVTGGYDYEPTIGDDRISCGSQIRIKVDEDCVEGRFEWVNGDDHFTIEDRFGKIWSFPWGVECDKI